jgi:hypothetical protein
LTHRPRQSSLSLDDVFSLIDAGAFGLPSFQRPFRWGNEQIKELLSSVFKGWPAGLILLMEVPSTAFFDVRPIEGLRAADLSAIRHLILDGQQRITALAHAFGLAESSDGTAWYLNVDKYLSGIDAGDLDDAFIKRQMHRVEPWDRNFIPLSAIRSARSFQTWRENTSTLVRVQSIPSIDDDDLNRLWLLLQSGLRNFAFPTSILASSMPLSAIAAIFERLNTAGMPLNTFDLVVAHVYRNGHDLRAEWDSAILSSPYLHAFALKDPLVAVELVAMVVAKDTRRSAILNLEADILWENWPKAILALEAAVKFFVLQAGVRDIEELPNKAFLIALAGCAFKSGRLDENLGHVWLHWFYSRGLGERFNAAVNTRVVAEYRHLLDLLAGGAKADYEVARDWLLQATPRQNSSIFATLQAILRKDRPVYFSTSLFAEELPDADLRAINILGHRGEDERDLVFGYVLVPRIYAKRVSGETLANNESALYEFVTHRRNSVSAEQFLPAWEAQVWRDPQQFVEYRVAAVLQYIDELAVLARNEIESHGGGVVSG